MKTIQPETLVKMRAVVGYLGEREQAGWWQSSFFAPGSLAFLAPVFGRTQLLAQMHGVTRAAALVHDGRIGVGRVYHLFRLPEELEQAIQFAVHDEALSRQVAGLTTGRAAGLAYLRSVGETAAGMATGGRAEVGPVHIGPAQALREVARWAAAAAHYSLAFENGQEVFPYFADAAK